MQEYIFYNFRKQEMVKLFDWLLAIILSILVGVKIYLLLVGVLFVFDTILGVMTLKKRGLKFSLNTLLTGIVTKMVFYTPAIISIYLIDTILLGDLITPLFKIENLITKLGTFAVLSKELISINRLSKILFGKSITEDADVALDNITKYKNKVRDILK